MRSETVAKRGEYYVLSAEYGNKKSVNIKVHQGSFRQGEGIPQGVCIFRGVVQDGFVQVDGRSPCYFRYVPNSNAPEVLRASLEALRFTEQTVKDEIDLYERLLTDLNMGMSANQCS